MWLVGPSLLVRPPEMQLLHAVWICPLNPRGGHPPAERGARPVPCGVPETHGTEPSCCPLLTLDWSSLLPACPPVWTKTFTLTPASWGASPPPKVSRAPGSLRMPCRPCLSFLGLSSAVWGTGTSDRPRPPQQVVNPTAGGRGRTQPAAGPRRPPWPCVCRTSWSRQRCRFAVGGLHPRGALPMGASVSPSVGVCGDRPGKCAAAGGPGPRTRPWSQGGRQRPRSALRLT